MNETQQPAVAGPVEPTVRPLTLEDCEHLFWLAARDYVFFATYNEKAGDWDNGWHPAINCNDTFYYASADACGLEPHEAKEVRAAVEQWGWAGAVAWCALKRNQEPLKQLQTEQYRAAMLALRPNVGIEPPKVGSSDVLGL
jgi:hypothetical protein